MLVVIIVIIAIICGVAAICIKLIVFDSSPQKLAEKYVSDNMIKEAIGEYKKLLKKSPNNMLTYYKLGELYLKNKSYDEGIECFEKIVSFGKYDKGLNKYKVLKKLGRAYLLNDEVDKAFGLYCDILNENHNDEEALLQVGFSSLGQEMFDVAFETFEKLLTVTANANFEVYFGAGIAALQLSRLTEAIEHFKSALKLLPESDIANLAIAFAFKKKKEYQHAIEYLQKISNSSNDHDAIFIASRLSGILHYQHNAPNPALKIYERLLDAARSSRSEEELKMVLYDMGFICVACERVEDALNHWQELQGLDANYKKVRKLANKVMTEIENNIAARKDLLKNEELGVFVNEWLNETFPEKYIWRICGLKSQHLYDLQAIYNNSKGAEKQQAASEDSSQLIEKLNGLDFEKFKKVAGRVVQKMGYTINETLNTYKESDGIDFKATSGNRASVLIWVRKWKGVSIGEIPINDFAQAVRDLGADEGVFIATAKLTSQGVALLKTMPNIKFVSSFELSSFLSGLV